MAKRDVKTYFTIGGDARSGVFVRQEICEREHSGNEFKVFEKAVKQADEKFREITHAREAVQEVRK